MGRQLSSTEKAWRSALRAARAFCRTRDRVQGPRQGWEARRARARMMHAFARCEPPPGNLQDPVAVASAGLAEAIERNSQSRIRQWKECMSSGS
eukprot:13150788-Alexandrium_andersonii.AAC.1